MLLKWTTGSPKRASRRTPQSCHYRRSFVSLLFFLALSVFPELGLCITVRERTALKNEAQELFYHGYDNYMRHALPEDELRPLSCAPLTRDRENPAHIEVNDVLGNYSLTLVDSLSTLAILASDPPVAGVNRNLIAFQDGVSEFVRLYGDGTNGSTGQGVRQRGFDLDSKVQVFETVIRGLGGLLSAHLFAIGQLPIRGYEPKFVKDDENQQHVISEPNDRAIRWANGMIYDGQLLRLAHDLGNRLVPAFYTPTGIPYPRVNLRDGVPFYEKSPLNLDPESGQCDAEQKGTQEITETCSAGAGSLVLEFSLLSRLTGDTRFEDLAKRAFWAVWNRRSSIGLIGSGINAESGEWVGSYTGIGAGIDSFFEYAFKSYVFLSNDFRPQPRDLKNVRDPRDLFPPLTDDENSPAGFLSAWTDAHAAIRRHIYHGKAYQHPHYIQGDLYTGATRAFWIDSLSAFYPGLLTLAGEIEEAVETHLLTTALWTRYSALPERWNLGTGDIEGGLGWWGGRPEFIESTYHLYRATRDPWYLHVGEMALRDIKRRCWTPCGWAGIQDVRTGQLNDRMESFFLSETAKYLFLLFDEDHPLNQLDGPFVFSTEGHPLIIPRNLESVSSATRSIRDHARTPDLGAGATCPTPPKAPPFGLSHTAARDDIFHAATLARLHLMPARQSMGSLTGEYAADHPSVSLADIQSPSNYTFYPWTLPPSLVARNATSAPLASRPTFDISFPTLQNLGSPIVPLQRVKDGILINHIGGVRLGMVQDVPIILPDRMSEGYRVHFINNLALGKDEKIFLSADATSGILNPTDPNFTRIRDPEMFDLVLDLKSNEESTIKNASSPMHNADQSDTQVPSSVKSALKSILTQFNGLFNDLPSSATPSNLSANGPINSRYYVPAITATGIGAVPIPDWKEAPSRVASGQPQLKTHLSWTRIYVTDELCSDRVSRSVARTHQVLVVKRGGCSFSTKLSNIPSFAPSHTAIQLVVMVDFDNTNDQGTEADGDSFDEARLIRPLLDIEQKTPKGMIRRHPVPLAMVGGGEKIYQALRNAVGVGVKRRYRMEARGVTITNLIIV